MYKKQEKISQGERFKCAGALLLRGLSAPITRPFIYIGRTPATSQDDDWVRQEWSMGAKARVGEDIISLFYGAAKGFVAGSILCAQSLIEAPQQLFRTDAPQNRPWLERKYNW